MKTEDLKLRQLCAGKSYACLGLDVFHTCRHSGWCWFCSHQRAPRVLLTLSACCLPIIWQLLVLLCVNAGSDHCRSGTAPAVYPCKGAGRNIFSGHHICCTKLRPHLLQPRLEQSSICGEGSVHAKGASIRVAL